VGGINEQNAAAFIKAGALGLGVGGNLVNKEWMAAGEWEKITDLARRLVKSLKETEEA
jgi:2-dehydro-3-deoxyphosphogluconate aldolase/(4S)-4-hydroxy-2-oxoglutarate aldolase